MRAFRRQKGRYVAQLDAAEREVVASVVADVAELLGAGRLEDGPRPGGGPSGGVTPTGIGAPIHPSPSHQRRVSGSAGSTYQPGSKLTGQP